jgi:CheY-like chemotaxis protein
MKKLMIVDDDEQLRTVLRAILEQEGYEVSVAESGQKCLDMLKSGEKPDLILLDVMMPEMDGWETCRIIKEDKKLRALRVAMLTVKSHDKDKMKSLGYATADWHIAKPIDKKKFVKTVKWILSE